MTQSKSALTLLFSADQYLNHWLGQRRLTRKVFLAFPDDKLFSFSVGGMRPFGQLFQEILLMSTPTIKGIVTDQWDKLDFTKSYSKDELLSMWDQATKDISEWWSKIPAEKFQQEITMYGQYEGSIYNHLAYIIDNEIHHRAQGYVYLRALGIEPPMFWDRA